MYHNKIKEMITMAWNLGLQPRDTNLFRLLEENERRQKKAYLKKVMPCATDSELEAFL